jgi:hypothetical protein
MERCKTSFYCLSLQHDVVKDYQDQVSKWITEGRWDEIAFYQGDSAENLTPTRWALEYALMRCQPFRMDAARTLERLFGPFDSRKWMEWLGRHRYPREAIEYVIDWDILTHAELYERKYSDKGLNWCRGEYIDEELLYDLGYLLQRPQPTMLRKMFWRSPGMYRYDMLDTLFDYGADPNECCDKGRPLLLDYVECYFVTDSNCDGEYVGMIRWLMERGADPLLENREGKSAWSAMEQMLECEIAPFTTSRPILLEAREMMRMYL